MSLSCCPFHVSSLPLCAAEERETPVVVARNETASKQEWLHCTGLNLNRTVQHLFLSGWLTKLGGSGLTPKNWRRRWFVLKDNTVYYYKTPSDRKVSQKLHLQDGFWKMWSVVSEVGRVVVLDVEMEAVAGGVVFERTHGCRASRSYV